MADFKPLQTKQWLALLAALFVIVLIAHLAIITSATAQFGVKKAGETPTFSTRMIELPAVVPVVEKMAEVVSPPKVSKITKIAKRTERTESTQAAKPLAAAPLVPQSAPVLPDTAVLPPKPTEAAEAAQATSAATTATIGDPTTTTPAFVALESGLHTYKINFTKNGVSNQGSADISWRQDGEKYTLNLLATYTLLFKNFNVFEQNSTGNISPFGLQPARFSDKRLNRSEVAAHFNYASEKIIFSANKPDVPLLAGAQDRLSVIWQLAGMLAAQPARYPPGSTLTVQTVSASDAEPWLFTVNEPETLNLTSGSHIALRLTRNPRREFDQKIELWFATGLNYLPARFRFTETNGDYVDAVWQSIQTVSN